MEPTGDNRWARTTTENSDGRHPGQSERPNSRREGQRVLATVYDAVAGRVTHHRVLRDEGRERRRPSPDEDEDGAVRDTASVAPADVLFRRKDAPDRYAEHDIYQAHERDLPQGGRGVLPTSDLLKAIHAYSSAFYGALDRKQPGPRSGFTVDDRSMDETALLAFGILLEEAGREALGRRGDAVFTEGAREEEGSGSDSAIKIGPHHAAGHHNVASSQGDRKRRKVVKVEEP